MARSPDVESSEAPRQRTAAAAGRDTAGPGTPDATRPEQVAPVRRRRSREREAAEQAAAEQSAPAAKEHSGRTTAAKKSGPRKPAATTPTAKQQPRAKQPAARQAKPAAGAAAAKSPGKAATPTKAGTTTAPAKAATATTAGRKQPAGAPQRPGQQKPGQPSLPAAAAARPGTEDRAGAQPSADELPELVPEPVGRFNRLLIGPDTTGPRVRMGVLWFFLTLAAATGGRWWTAALWAVAAAIAAAHTVGAWQLEYLVDDANGDGDGAGAHWTSSASLRWIAAGAAAVVPLAAGYGTGLAGVTLIAVAVACGLGQLLVRDRARDTGVVSIAVLLAAMAAASVVIAVRTDLWAGLFLILAVSLYDAGSYLMGAEAAVRWEGPVAGVIGVLAVTFTIATIDPPPFDRGGAWLTGAVVAVGCVVGQWVASANLPRTTAAAPGLRRLDAYVVAGPAFVACVWLLGT